MCMNAWKSHKHVEVPQTGILPSPFYVKDNSPHQSNFVQLIALPGSEQSSEASCNHIATKGRKEMPLNQDEFAMCFRGVKRIQKLKKETETAVFVLKHLH